MDFVQKSFQIKKSLFQIKNNHFKTKKLRFKQGTKKWTFFKGVHGFCPKI